jgi:hypothetical protein
MASHKTSFSMKPFYRLSVQCVVFAVGLLFHQFPPSSNRLQSVNATKPIFPSANKLECFSPSRQIISGKASNIPPKGPSSVRVNFVPGKAKKV